MKKQSASEGELAVLHARVAKIMLQQLDGANRAMVLLQEHRADLPTEVAEYLSDAVEASPALLGVITKFLKDNNISAVIEESDEMTDLAKKLRDKKQRKIVGNVIPIVEE